MLQDYMISSSSCEIRGSNPTYNDALAAAAKLAFSFNIKATLNS